jgi:hypothetical protein
MEVITINIVLVRKSKYNPKVISKIPIVIQLKSVITTILSDKTTSKKKKMASKKFNKLKKIEKIKQIY